MHYRILDLSYSRKKGGIDDEPLQRLLHGHEVVSRTERLYHHDGEPHLLVSVLYRLAALPADRDDNARRTDNRSREGGAGEADDWRSLLEEKDMRLFETLRAWRTRKARDEAVPPYVILTNVQLARIASIRPGTLAALKDIPGVGKSRLDRLGKEILGIVANGTASAEPSGTGERKRQATEAESSRIAASLSFSRGSSDTAVKAEEGSRSAV